MDRVSPRPVDRVDLAAALALLGKRHLVFAIHDVSFPGGDDEDIGRGSPYSRGARDLFAFLRGLGFTGVQLGPQGQTSAANPSPYDAALFSREVLSINLPALARDPAFARVLPPAALDAALEGRPPRPRAGFTERADHPAAFRRQLPALAAAFAEFERRRAAADPAIAELAAAVDAFAAANAGWLERDALHEALATSYAVPPPATDLPDLRVSFGGAYWRTWPSDQDLWASRDDARVATLSRTFARELRFYRFCQALVARQHALLRQDLAATHELPPLRLFGDLQVGISVGDAWAMQGLFLRGYAMGAPPSRTNPDGQPWGYPVLDPDLYFESGARGPALRLLAARVDAMLRDYDGLRIDHPHGLVCPWVYRTDEADVLRAVQSGARLFDSPDLPDHPALARHAIARPDQLDRDRPRHADGWVRALDDAQVRRYSAQIDVVMAAAAAHGRSQDDVLCEVLSTQPYPLQRVLARYGLGRFRVTQKADLENPADVYRSENARPEDWVMLGNHDTPSIWTVADRWRETGTAAAQAAYLAARLGDRGDNGRFAARLAADPAALVHAKFADLLVCPARQVMIFMSDLFGIREPYNVPGTVATANWSLRLRNGCTADYWDAAARGEALDLGWSLALALRARGPEFARQHADLLARLERDLGRPC
jgi:4-alpha-glucanotransferase